MRMLALSMVFSFGLAGQALAVKDAAEVRRILDRYMAVTHPKSPSKTAPYDREADAKVNQAQAARRAILAELRDVPGEAMSVVGQVLSQLASPKQRFEIVGTLGDHTHTRECAELLHRVLQDVRTPQDEEAALYEELVRSSAVHGLRMMSRRTHRSGGQRSQRKPDFEAKVPGLVAHLIFAANDRAERVRVNAMYALADSRDPAAVAELRRRVGDKSGKVRLYAACFLTEYQDATGLPEMRKALNRLREMDSTSPQQHLDYLTQTEMVLASHERITGKSFGEIPLNPSLSGTHNGGTQRYRELLDTWHAWWTWQPEGRAERNP